eukprot:31479-Pelagococcus_subviridis.AAC.2
MPANSYRVRTRTSPRGRRARGPTRRRPLSRRRRRRCRCRRLARPRFLAPASQSPLRSRARGAPTCTDRQETLGSVVRLNHRSKVR